MLNTTQQTTQPEQQMDIRIFGPVNYEGYQLTAAYEYEAPDPDVGMGAVYTVISASINNSPFDAYELINPAVIQWIEAQIASKHEAEEYDEGPDFDDWREQREAA